MRPIHYQKQRHIKNLIEKAYYANLIRLRNVIEIACDGFFQSLGAQKIDLFMVAKGISSPMGKGSDSEPIPFSLGKEHAYLVDSSQFGMEPLVQKSFKLVYCYLPSFRGEDADYRHLNQFYHCEAEIRGNYKENMTVAENLVKYILNTMRREYSHKAFAFRKHNFQFFDKIIASRFPTLSLDEAEKLMHQNSIKDGIEYRPYGRVLTLKGEEAITRLVGGNRLPVWVTNYDRDTVPFYQKPNPNNPNTTLNADLLFPSINGGFGGEIIGSGQRQDSVKEILKSMSRQGVRDVRAYKWYINLRNRPDYKVTSGFGMGIERFIAWSLGVSSIHDVAVYPIIKNESLLV